MENMSKHQPNDYANMREIILESEKPVCFIVAERGAGRKAFLKRFNNLFHEDDEEEYHGKHE